MATIERYVLVDRDDHEGEYEYETLDEAQGAAGTTHAVIARIYEYDDSELVWTPNGSNRWPPKARPTRTKVADRIGLAAWRAYGWDAKR